MLLILDEANKPPIVLNYHLDLLDKIHIRDLDYNSGRSDYNYVTFVVNHHVTDKLSNKFTLNKSGDTKNVQQKETN